MLTPDAQEAEADRLLRLEPDQLRPELLRLLKEVNDLRGQLESTKQQEDKSSPYFVIDTEPHDTSVEKSSSIRFESSFLPLKSSSPPPTSTTTTTTSSSRLNSCFNCGKTDHALTHCREPRDFARITQNKRKFASQRYSTSNNSLINSSSRYHLDEIDSKFVPGAEISKRLREALGLKERQLPQFVYRMRVLGYPPGWMAEAQTQRSEISIYLDPDMKQEMNEDDDMSEEAEQKMEDGECDADAEDRAEYDIEKFVLWTGFNAPMPKGFTDEAGRHRCPPHDPDQSLSAMIAKLGHRAKKVTLLKKPVQERRVDKSKNDQNDSDQDNSDNNDNEGSNSGGRSPSTPTPSKVSLLEICTPIVGYHSPFTELPNAQKWAEGSSEIVNFENLPNTTGHWDKMRSLLARQRSGHQQEDFEEEAKKKAKKQKAKQIKQEEEEEEEADLDLEFDGVKVELDFFDC